MIRNVLARCGFFLFMAVLTFGILPAQAQTDPGLVVYPGPSGATRNSTYTVQVRKEGGTWQNLFCYGTNAGQHVGRGTQTSVVYFDADFSSRIEVQVVKASGTVTGVRIRPTSYGMQFTRNGNTVSFFMDRPRKLSIEFNGDIYNNLQVFANPLEVNPPKQGNAGVTYFGPNVANAGTINLTSNQTLYLAGGAVVTANVTINNSSNVKILGRGILVQGTSRYGIGTTGSSNVTIDGIIIFNERQQWTVVPATTNDIIINNVKLLCAEIYSDGIDPCSCQRLVISDCFIRSGDDDISIKARGSSPNTDITVKNTILWGDGAHGVLIGPEGSGAITSAITFDSIDVLEVNCPAGAEWWGVVGITCSGNVTMRDMTFKNFNIDNFTLSELFNIRIESNQYVSTPGAAIRNIKYINWSYTGPNTNSNLIQGYDATRTVDSVYFINLRINGNLVLNAAQAKCQIGSNAFHIFFQPGPTEIQNQATAQRGINASSGEARIFIPGQIFQLPARYNGMKVYSLQGRMLAPEAEWYGFAGQQVSKFTGIILK